MAIGAFAEPLAVIFLLAGGTWINRTTNVSRLRTTWGHDKRFDAGSSSDIESGHNSNEPLVIPSSRSSSDWNLPEVNESGWQMRRMTLLGRDFSISSPSTVIFSDRLLSRLLSRYPFLVEVWYWALIYWVYQLARAFTAVNLVQGTANVARNHALQLIEIEKQLNIFWEPAIQQFFMQCPALLRWINRIYSFIHIPGSILFLVWLYYVIVSSKRHEGIHAGVSSPGPQLYERRRRAMAMSNMLAFQIFTIWPCMPPRLLSDPAYQGAQAELAKSYGFIDTVHAPDGESSVWTTNKFCNQYAAMPSLHFGYSLLIGLTIATIPLDSNRTGILAWQVGSWRIRASLMKSRRALCILLGTAYPLLILAVIVATANHFILDAIAGAVICGLAWHTENVLLNLLPIEDWFLWCLRLHKPQIESCGGGHSSEKGSTMGMPT